MNRLAVLCLMLAACGGAVEAPEPAPAPEALAEAAPAPAPEAAPAAAPAEEAEAAATGPADLAKGKATYEKVCQACHQADGSGMNSMLAANFKDPGRLDKTDAELLTSIRDGFQGKIGMMPPWKGTLSEQDMVDVLGHIRATYGE